MDSAMQAILTDAQARDAQEVETRLSEELGAGAPWFDEGA